MEYLKNLKWDMMWFSIVSIAMGLLMVLFPGQIMSAVCIIIAATLFLLGLKNFIEYKKELYNNMKRTKLVECAVCVAGGIFVIVGLDAVLSFITYVIAIMIIISGIIKIQNALELRKMNSHWIPLMIFAVLCVLLGISVLMMPMNHNDDGTRTAGDFMIQCTGVILMITGLIDLVTTMSVSGKIKVWTMSHRDDEEYEEVIMESSTDEDDVLD